MKLSWRRCALRQGQSTYSRMRLLVLVVMCCVLVVQQGQSTYSRQIKQVEDDIQSLLKKINELTGMRSIIIIIRYYLHLILLN